MGNEPLWIGVDSCNNAAMAILGAHMSMAGGYYKAVEAARRVGGDCVQLFTKNNNQWRAKPIEDAEAVLFQSTLKRLKIKHPISHASYLINLATPEAEKILAAAPTVRLSGRLEYQACDDRVCYAPTRVPVSFTLTVKAPPVP